MAVTKYWYYGEDNLTTEDSKDKGLTGYSLYLRLKITWDMNQASVQFQFLGKTGMVRALGNFYSCKIDGGNAWSYNDGAGGYGHGARVSDGVGGNYSGTITGSVNTWTNWYSWNNTTNPWSDARPAGYFTINEWKWGNHSFNSGVVQKTHGPLTIWNFDTNTYIYNGSAWVPAKPFVYDGSAWKPAKTYVYDGSTWKPA